MYTFYIMYSRGLMNRALDLKPEVTQGCEFESRLRQEASTTEVRPLSKAPIPQTAPVPGRRKVGCPLLQFGWVKCREHISLLIILCILVYVTNKAHLSLICIVLYCTHIYTHNNMRQKVQQIIHRPDTQCHGCALDGIQC